MGDRCYLEMSLRNMDAERAAKALNVESLDDLFDEIEGNGDWLRCIMHEANYGFWSEHEILTAEKIDFYGSHGPGDGYPAAVFVAAAGEHIDLPAIRGTPVVEVEPPGSIRRDQLKPYARYFQLLEELTGIAQE